MMVVLRGAVRLSKSDLRGREMVRGLERPGASVGDLPLFDGGTSPVDATTTSPEGATVFIVPRPVFERLLTAQAEMSAEVIRTLAIESRRLIETLKAQALHTVHARLAAYLLHAANGERTFPLAETNAAICSGVRFRCAASRSSSCSASRVRVIVIFSISPL